MNTDREERFAARRAGRNGKTAKIRRSGSSSFFKNISVHQCPSVVFFSDRMAVGHREP
jgi:hypothetical protein